MGYYQAGFDVVGVDINFQKNYPFEFHQADALTYPLGGFDVVHASPPCQHYSQICKAMGIAADKPDLIAPIRDRISVSSRSYIIENVKGAPLRDPIMICGAAFNLGASGMDLPRHRYFESNIGLLTLPCTHRKGHTMGVYGNGTNKWHLDKIGRCLRVDEMREAMGINWMTRKELSQAIPPAYTEYIGRQLIQYLDGITEPSRTRHRPRR